MSTGTACRCRMTNGGGSPRQPCGNLNRKARPISAARACGTTAFDPMETRRVIGMCLDIAATVPADSRAPVFRM